MKVSAWLNHSKQYNYQTKQSYSITSEKYGIMQLPPTFWSTKGIVVPIDLTRSLRSLFRSIGTTIPLVLQKVGGNTSLFLYSYVHYSFWHHKAHTIRNDFIFVSTQFEEIFRKMFKIMVIAKLLWNFVDTKLG